VLQKKFSGNKQDCQVGETVNGMGFWLVQGESEKMYLVLMNSAPWNAAYNLTLSVDGGAPYYLATALDNEHTAELGGEIPVQGAGREILHAMYNGQNLTISTGTMQFSFPLKGSATSIALLHQCAGEIITEAGGIPIATGSLAHPTPDTNATVEATPPAPSASPSPSPAAPATPQKQPPAREEPFLLSEDAPMRFEVVGTGGNCGACAWIAAEGEITSHTPDDFKAFLEREHGGPGIIRLNSPGGSVIAGLKLGEMFRAGGYSTEVGATHIMSGDPSYWSHATSSSRADDGSCASACAYAFLGGLNRTAKAGTLGFHQFYNKEPASVADGTSEAQAITGLLISYLKEMGIDSEILALASTTSPDELYRPDAATMTRLKITNTQKDFQFAGWTVKPYHTGAMVVGTTVDADNNEIQLALYCRKENPSLVYLLGSWTYSFSSEPVADQTKWLRDAISMDTQIHAGPTLTIGKTAIREGASGVNAWVDNGHYYISYALSADEFDQGLQSGFSVDVKLPHAMSQTYGVHFEPPVQGLGQLAGIAFKSCI
jgi:hypothetical protein